MEVIFETVFGSHVYGTNIPTSDTDIKGVIIPSVRDIILQKANRTSLNTSTKEDERAKNTTTDIDKELFYLQAFLKLCADGQTVALDMLFTPKKFWKVSNYQWDFIQANRSKLIHSGTTAFVGYCRQQAAKYGIKGSRISAVRKVIEFFSGLNGPGWRLEDTTLPQSWLDGTEEFIIVKDHIGPSKQLEPHLFVCNRCFSMNTKTEYIRTVLQKILDNYGHRALLAEKNEGIDWKALMHAVRVCCEAVELLERGHITFPRPERASLLMIRKGEIPYKNVAEMIEKGLECVEQAKAKSTLPISIDQVFWEEWLFNEYRGKIIADTAIKSFNFFKNLF